MPRVSRRKIAQRIGEALALLRDIGMPDEQLNDRSALTLLALLDLKPEAPWSDSKASLIGVTPVMEFIRQVYMHQYAPNTRETIRRYTLHQFIQAGFVVLNPDDLGRPTNSPKNVYQVTKEFLQLARAYDSPDWARLLPHFLQDIVPLRDRYAAERAMNKLPLEFPDGTKLTLSPGGQNVLVKRIIEEFGPRFLRGGTPIYVGDTAEKWSYFDEEQLRLLGVSIPEHGKIPDVAIYDPSRNWLVLIEAVTSHGPVTPKRQEELKALFQGCEAGLVFVSTFPDYRTFIKYASKIAWETEVWIADAPSHMIHFNGDKFLGPYSG